MDSPKPGQQLYRISGRQSGKTLQQKQAMEALTQKLDDLAFDEGLYRTQKKKERPTHTDPDGTRHWAEDNPHILGVKFDHELFRRQYLGEWKTDED